MNSSNVESIAQIGARFREERERLGYSQSALGEHFASTRKTLANWESGVTMPDANHLLVFHRLGADVMYILTGRRSPLMAAEKAAAYATPAHSAAAEIAAMPLTSGDADLLLDFARRLAGK